MAHPTASTWTLVLLAAACGPAAGDQGERASSGQSAEVRPERPTMVEAQQERATAVETLEPRAGPCAAELVLPNVAEDNSAGSCTRQPLLGGAVRVTYPCGGGPGELRSPTVASNVVQEVQVDGHRLQITVRSDPYLIYGCHTEVVESVVANLETGRVQYTYDDDWSGPDHCQADCTVVRREGELAGQERVRAEAE